MNAHQYYIYYKPFGVLSQFSDEDGHHGLKRYLDVPQDVYPVGRLDRDSEGLLLLTNDRSLNDALLNPRHHHRRTYYVQVEGLAGAEHMRLLQQPMAITVKKTKYVTAPCTAKVLDEVPALPDRDPPIRFRASIPTSWISMELTEGKNRQVRKMTANVGLPTLRLVRFAIEALTLEGMNVGELRETTAAELRRMLHL